MSMTNGCVFIDTAFVQAVLNRRDQYHNKATALLNRVRDASEVWITEAVLIEIGNALASMNRKAAVEFIRSCYVTPNMRVAEVDADLFKRGLDFYSNRPDKEWGLTDCISILVMQDHGITEAFTSDEHFKQAGLRALLIE